MKTYIVQLEPHDDILSAKDKIAWSKATRVLLVWPQKGSVLERRVDLLLLLRACQQRGVQMAIVTRSGEVKAHARDLGIPVFANPVKAQSSPWRRRGARDRKLLLGTRLDGPRRPIATEALRAQRDALLGPKKQPGVWDRPIRLVIFTVGVLAFLTLVLFFAPSARVELTPQRKTQKLTIPVWASTNLHVPNPSGGVPAYPLSAVIEGRDQGESTGRTRIPDGTATGQVQLTNLTDQPVDVPSGTLVLTLDSPVVHFVTTKAVTVPAGVGSGGAGVMVAPIRAAAPGSAGTVSAGKIRAMEGPNGLRLAVDNPLPTSGGTDRSAPSPSSADYQALKEKLLVDLQSNALEELKGKLKTGQNLLEPTLSISRVIEESQLPAVDQPAERFQLVLRVEFTAWMVEEADLRTVSEAALEANRDKAFQPVPDSLRFAFASEMQKLEVSSENGAPAGSVRWNLEIERTLEAAWSREQVIQRIQGRPASEALGILQRSLPLAGAPRIQLYPSWWGRLPFLPFRIEMVTT